MRLLCGPFALSEAVQLSHSIMGGDIEHGSISMAPNDEIAPQTTEPHFTEPVKREQTTYTIDRYTHRVPVDWFLVAAGEIDAWTYEQYVANEQQFDEKTVNHAVETVDFDYEREPNHDGTGKPFSILFSDAKGDETNWYSRTHYLLRLLNYDEDTYEVVAVTQTDERGGVLVTIQERLPHLPTG